MSSDCKPVAMADSLERADKPSGPSLVRGGSWDITEGDKCCDQWDVEFSVAEQGVLQQVAWTMAVAALHVLVMAATWLLSSWGCWVVTPVNWYLGFNFYAVLVSTPEAPPEFAVIEIERFR